jgi:carbonic anhydrase/acetyltransferase-like protein (isoleucine patch superfamily)
MAVFSIGDRTPEIDPEAFVHEQATVIGSVTLRGQTSVWAQAVIRGDNEIITLEDRCNVQDGAVLHTDPGYPMQLATGVSVGHQAMLHGCRIGANSLVGIQSIILNGAVIGSNCLIGAGTLITEGKQFPDNVLIFGRPGKVVRDLKPEELVALATTAAGYVLRAAQYREQAYRLA